MKYINSIFTILLIFSFSFIQAQDPFPIQDSLCIQLGEPINYNVKQNDDPPFSQLDVYLEIPSDCFILTKNGEIRWASSNPPAECCGPHTLFYHYDEGQEFAQIDIIVKCAKPDCGVGDLSDYSDGSSPGNPLPKATINACEESEAIYFVPFNPANKYTWSYSGETSAQVNPLNPAEIAIFWGVAGGGYISIDIYNMDSTLILETIEVCVNILDGPEAAFTALDSCVCKNSPISFINNSIGGNDFFWDFGDGNNSNDFSPTHNYNLPGTYEVILYVTQDNYGPMGEALCCCTDTATLTVTVDSLDGPEIFWISTLCEGDSSKYWTDADCGSYVWTAMDANGTTVPVFPTANPDTVCIVWPMGPYGTITLAATGCTPALCEKPVSVLVPVIQKVSNILGQTLVCSNSSHTYTLPKWPSVEYIWTVSGGMIQSGNGTNSVSILWGPAGPGTIDVTYGSDFLNGLPNHTGDECSGTAHLDVIIRDAFSVSNIQSKVCIGDQTMHDAIPPTGYNWVISPYPGFTIPSGTSSATINWNVPPDNYIITVYPSSPGVYCNDSVKLYVTVTDIESPDSISGEFSICPLDTYIYFPHSATTNVGFEWHVIGGSIDNINGNPVNVTWNATGPYSIGLSQFDLSDPGCHSDTITYVVKPKTIDPFVDIDGDDACVNEISSYFTTPPQDDDATYKWTISPINAGSVFSPQGLPNVDIQWNNLQITATLTVTIYLCGDSLVYSEPIIIHKATVPTIIQNGYLCPGVPAQLEAPIGYVNYTWTPGTSTINTQTINAPGVYELVVEDGFGCTAVASFEAFNVAGPVAKLSTPSFTTWCLPDDVGKTTVIVAQTSGNEYYTWYCNGTPQVLPSTATTLTHTVGAAGQFCYWADVQDMTTLCVSRSDTICIFVAPDCEIPQCIPGNYNINTTAVAHDTFCNVVTFSTSGFGYSIQGWNFLDPNNNGFSGPLSNPTHVYTEAGCYLARVMIRVPNNMTPPTDSCLVMDTASICVPIAADFEWTTDCAKYFFSDLSTYLAPQNITSWLWDFGDGNYSPLQNPMHSFAPGMTFNVKLTVANAAGCQATITKVINTYGQPDATFIAVPDTVCVGDEVHFIPTGITTNILYYNWDFGDLSTNGGMSPYHGYLVDNSYLVSLIVEDKNGCKDTFSTIVKVYPLPPPDTIVYTPSLVICSGQTATLTAPNGASWMWNNGLSTQIINVTTSGVYAVTVTDANGCILIPDSLEITVLPPLNPIISGNDIVCEGSCVTLSTITGFGYTYIWRDAAFNVITSSTGPTLEICHPSPFYSEVTVEVTDQNGCREISPPFFLTVKPNPGVSINIISGILCEGDPTDLEAVSPTAGATFRWSNGVIGPNVTVIAGGTYTVTATDPTTGCISTASVFVNPAPDLCIVPFGCYDVCNPDTICGPIGLFAYQWYKDGVAILGPEGIMPCLEVSENGSYTLKGTNIFGCMTTSDPLILEMVICCDPDDTNVTAVPAQTVGDSCCWILSYENSIDSIFGMNIRTNDATLSYKPGSIVAPLNLNGSGPSYIALNNSPPTDPINTGTVNNFIEICLTSLTTSPAIVYVDWSDKNGKVVCTDTLSFECNIEPPCVYILHDSIYCENETVIYTLTICNPASNNFPFRYVNVVPISPLGITLSPTFFDYSATPIWPGTCRDETIVLGGGNFSNQNFCFNLIAHEFDPAVVDTAVCCSLDTTHCIPIPGCTMCDMVFISNIDTVDIDECCYEVEITNNFNAGAFTGINICALGGSTIQVQNTFTTMWNTINTTSTNVDLAVKPGAGGTIPLGSSILPDICITSSTSASTDIVIKWMNGADIECIDTISLFCPGDCGYLTDSISCGPDGGWIYAGYITNESNEIMNEAAITFTTPGFGIYNTNISLGSLAPNSTYGPFYLTFDNPPGNAGDVICMTVTLHSEGHNNQHETCCNFTNCFILPNCGGGEPNCECDAAFEHEVAMGINCSFDPASGTGIFSPVGNFSNCDKIIWDFLDLQISQMTSGNQSINQLFTKEGEYTLCMTVIRTTPTGKQCKEKFTKEFEIDLDGAQSLFVYPNPAVNRIQLSFRKSLTESAEIILLDVTGKIMIQWSEEKGTQEIPLDIRLISEGIYYLVVTTGNERFIEKILIIK